MEKTSSIVRKLTITVGAAVVQKKIDQAFVEAQKTAKLKGFREGQVPINIVKQNYGEDVRHHVLHDLIEESYRDALREHKLKTVGAPKIDLGKHQTGQGAHDHTLEEGKEFQFTATVEILPEIHLKNYTGISLTRDKTDITDQDIEMVVKGFLDSRSKLTPTLVGTEAKKGHFADIIFNGKLKTDSGWEEKEGMKGNQLIEIGAKRFIVGFEEELIGMKAGDTRTFKLKFPKDYHEKNFAEKEAEFTVTVNDLKNKTLPDLDDAFVKELGYENVAEFNKKAREHLTLERTMEVDRKVRSDLLTHLIKDHSFDVPMTLVQAQTRALAQELGQNLKQQGFNDQMIQDALKQELDNLKKKAENQVRASLILETIADQEKITVDPSEVENEIKNIAKQMQTEEEKVRQYYAKDEGHKDDLIFRLREDKVMKMLLEKAKIK